MKNLIRVIQRRGKPLMVDIGPVSDWDGFDKLIQYMKNEFSIEVLIKADGPGSRRWVLKSKGKEFELIHDDGYGNYMLAPKKESEQLVLEIAADLEKRFTD